MSIEVVKSIGIGAIVNYTMDALDGDNVPIGIRIGTGVVRALRAVLHKQSLAQEAEVIVESLDIDPKLGRKCITGVTTLDDIVVVGDTVNSPLRLYQRVRVSFYEAGVEERVEGTGRIAEMAEHRTSIGGDRIVVKVVSDDEHTLYEAAAEEVFPIDEEVQS